jgi:hypothetical protein
MTCGNFQQCGTAIPSRALADSKDLYDPAVATRLSSASHYFKLSMWMTKRRSWTWCKPKTRMLVSHLPDVEIIKIVSSAWRYQTEGRNLVGEKFVAATDQEVDELAAAFPDAFALLLQLRRLHRSRAEFVLGKATAKHLGWTLPRFRAARARLEERGYIRCIHRGGLCTIPQSTR